METKKRGRPPKKEINQIIENEYNNQIAIELASISDYISQFSGTGFTEVKLSDLNNWLRNPLKNLDKLILLSRYFYAKDGIVTDVYDMFKTLPVLNHSIQWEVMQGREFKDAKAKVDIFKKNIKPKQLARDTIFTTVYDGSCVWYNKDNKYIQFLEYNQIKIDTMVNGEWRVDFDLAYFDTTKDINKLQVMIKSAPNEVTLVKYNEYKKDKTKRYVPLDLKKTRVFKIRGDRNVARYLPYAIGAMASIIHRDILESTERSLANRINNQILLQHVGSFDDKSNPKPPSQNSVNKYHDALKRIVQTTDNGKNQDSVGTAVLTVPKWVDISELDIKMNVFSKEVYERIDRNIYQKLGISPSVNMGGGTGQNYGSSSINTEKIFSVIFYLLEQIEDALNDYLNDLVPEGFNPSIRFSRNTLVDKESQIKHNKELYLQGRGSLKSWVESVGHNFEHYLAECIYENEVLKLDEILKVHPTSYTQSGENVGGRPTDGKTKDDYKSNDIPDID